VSFAGVVASLCGLAPGQKTGRPTGIRCCEDQGAHRRARCVALVSLSCLY
jgi:hypothetical protein